MDIILLVVMVLLFAIWLLEIRRQKRMERSKRHIRRAAMIVMSMNTRPEQQIVGHKKKINKAFRELEDSIAAWRNKLNNGGEGMSLTKMLEDNSELKKHETIYF